MAESVFQKISIKGIAAAVPKLRVDNLKDHAFISEKERKNIVALTGIQAYRKAADNVCTSDLCAEAAQRLMNDLAIDPGTVDALVFATMTPDYIIPSTACLLQDRLGLSTNAIAYDINMGCSGYIVGLYNAAMLIQGGGLKRVLLLAGDTQTKLCHDQDKNVVFLMGDGGTATLLEAADAATEPIIIQIRTDGRRYDKLYVPAGGFRTPSTKDTREIRIQADGGMRSMENIHMDGMEIFKFSTTDVVKSMQSFIQSHQIEVEDIDYLVLHQANKFMTDKVGRKLKIPLARVPYSLHEYGNTGAASIPLTMVCHKEAFCSNPKTRCLLAGFGVGLSWGVIHVTLQKPQFSELIEI